jgi:hypothetical protein
MTSTISMPVREALVPEPFAAELDERVVLDLYAAAVALLARLSGGEPAGSIAEEIVAVTLVREATAWLELRVHRDELTSERARAATQALDGLWELFQGAEVLELFEVSDPAAVAPVAKWFLPFGWTAPTGYLDEREDADEA